MGLAHARHAGHYLQVALPPATSALVVRGEGMATSLGVKCVGTQGGAYECGILPVHF